MCGAAQGGGESERAAGHAEAGTETAVDALLEQLHTPSSAWGYGRISLASMQV